MLAKFRPVLFGLFALTLTACSAETDPTAPTAAVLDVPSLEAHSLDDHDHGQGYFDIRPTGSAELYARDALLVINHIGSSGRDGADFVPAEDEFSLKAATRPYELTDGGFGIGIADREGDVISANIHDTSSPYIALHLSTANASVPLTAVFFRNGRRVGQAALGGEVIPKLEIEQGGVAITSFGARADGIVVNLSLGWDNVRHVKWADASGHSYETRADRIELRTPRPTNLVDPVVQVRPIRKDSGEAHLDYLTTTMTNVAEERGRVLPVEDVILN